MADTLKTGFTGELDKKSGTVATRVRDAASYVKDEAGAIAASAQDHPSATSTALLVFGATAFLAGYLLGISSAQERSSSRFW